MDLTAISMWYVIKQVTESLQPAKIKISIRISITTDFFRVLSSVRCIFYNQTRHTEVRIRQPGCPQQDEFQLLTLVSQQSIKKVSQFTPTANILDRCVTQIINIGGTCNLHFQLSKYLVVLFVHIIYALCFMYQNWMAYEQFLPSSWKAGTFSKIKFSKYEIPSALENYALCKVSTFPCSNALIKYFSFQYAIT